MTILDELIAQLMALGQEYKQIKLSIAAKNPPPNSNAKVAFSPEEAQDFNAKVNKFHGIKDKTQLDEAGKILAEELKTLIPAFLAKYVKVAEGQQKQLAGVKAKAESIMNNNLAQVGEALIKGGGTLSVNILPYSDMTITELIIYEVSKGGLSTVDKQVAPNMGGKTFTFKANPTLPPYYYKVGSSYKAVGYKFTGSEPRATSNVFTYNGETTIQVTVPLPTSKAKPQPQKTPQKTPTAPKSYEEVMDVIVDLETAMKASASALKLIQDGNIALFTKVADLDGDVGKTLVDVGVTLVLTMIGFFPRIGDFMKDLGGLAYSHVQDIENHQKKIDAFSTEVDALQRVTNLYNCLIAEASAVKLDLKTNLKNMKSGSERAKLYNAIVKYKIAHSEAEEKISSTKGPGSLQLADIQNVILRSNYYVSQYYDSVGSTDHPHSSDIIKFGHLVRTKLIAPNNKFSAFVPLLKPYGFIQTESDRATKPDEVTSDEMVHKILPGIRIEKATTNRIRKYELPRPNTGQLHGPKNVESAE
jgi:hypothetical protein